MPNTKMTKEKLKVHFHYNKMIYLVVIIVAVIIGNLAFTTTVYQAPNERRVDIELIGYADTSTAGAAAAMGQLLAAGQAWEKERDSELGVDTAASGYEVPLQTVQFLSIDYTENGSSSDNYYALQKYMVTLAAQEGDIYVLPRSMMTDLVDQNALVPLDDYIESGVIDPGDRNLAKVTFDELDDNGIATGRQHVYALQADSLTGLGDALLFSQNDKYLVIVQFSKNQDTAAAVLQEMLNIFEPADGGEAAE